MTRHGQFGRQARRRVSLVESSPRRQWRYLEPICPPDNVRGGAVRVGFAPAWAQNDATWVGPTSDWNTASNWSTGAVPTGVATFAGATPTSITFSANSVTSVGALQFSAPAYTFDLGIGTLTHVNITGSGISANTGDEPTLTVNSQSTVLGALTFTGSSTAGPAIINVIDTANTEFHGMSTAGAATITAGLPVSQNQGFDAGFVTFWDQSTAGSATITALDGSNIEFHDSSNAGTAVLIANSGIAGTEGFIFFNEDSTADHATITVNNGGQLVFSHNDGGEFLGGPATAGDATITTKSGGLTLFENEGSGGNAQFITEAGGLVDISAITASGTTAGSIAGDGTYNLGDKQLTVGSNGLTTAVGGLIEGVGGSLVKVGAGTLTLTGVNTYSGGTFFNGGAIAVAADNALGPGGLTFNGGTLQFDSTFNLAATRPITLDAPGGGTFDTNGNDTTILQTISGAGGLTKAGLGALTLDGANTYSGGTTLAAGTLIAGDNGALGTGALTVAANPTGTTLDNTAAATSLANAIVLNPSANLTVAGSNPLTLAGAISGDGALTKNGASR